MRVVQVEDVDRAQLRINGMHHRRDRDKVFGHVIADRERRQRTAGDQQLLSYLDDLYELGRIAVQVNQIAGLLGSLRAAVHGHPDIGQSQGWRVVGAVTGHRDEVAAGLFGANPVHFVFRCRLGDELVDTGLGGDGRGSGRIVAGNHHGADSERPHGGQALRNARLDSVFEVDDPQ